MSNKPGTLVGASRFAAIPLAIAYVAIPLAAALMGLGDSLPETAPALPWLILAGMGTVAAMLFRRSGARLKKRFIFEVVMFAVLVAIIIIYGRIFLIRLDAVLPFVHEAVPLIMLLFCFLWGITFGVPDRGAFQRYGAVLGVLCIADLAYEAVMTQTVPAVRLLGNCDVLSGLLLVSLCAGLKPGANDGGVFEPDQGHALWRGLVLVGLASCFSRTGLFGAAWVVLCFGRGSIIARSLLSILFLALIGASFYFPTTASDAVRYVNYWLWVESVRLFSADPTILLTGFPISNALPFTFPPGMSTIWEAATGVPALLGVYLPQVPSFWLRLILGWGLLLPVGATGLLFLFLFRRLSRLGAGLTAGLFTQGMSTPLLFNPVMGAVIGLALLLAFQKPRPTPNVRREVPNETPEPEPVDPPASADEEFGLHPL